MGLVSALPAWNLVELDLSGLHQVEETSLDNLLAATGSTLKVLDISYCILLGDGALASIAQHGGALRSLAAASKLSGVSRFTPAGLLGYLRGAHNLASLDLSGSAGVNRAVVAMLTSQLASSLTSLSLARCYNLAADAQGSPVLDILAACTRLISLDLSGVILSRQVLAAALDLPSLVSLAASVHPATLGNALTQDVLSSADHLEFLLINAIPHLTSLSTRARAASSIFASYDNQDLTQMLSANGVALADPASISRAGLLGLCVEYYIHGVPQHCPLCSAHLRRTFAAQTYSCANQSWLFSPHRCSLLIYPLNTGSLC